jgi:hypothetical protein
MIDGATSQLVRFAAAFELVEHTDIVKRSDSDLAVLEGALTGALGGTSQVVEIDLNQAVVNPPNHAHMLPVIARWRARRALGQ